MFIMNDDTNILPDYTGIPWLDQIIELANNITRRIIKETQQTETQENT